MRKLPLIAFTLALIAAAVPAAAAPMSQDDPETPVTSGEVEPAPPDLSRVLPDRWEEFESPVEILNGGYPAEEPYISDQITVRRGFGLDASREFVAALVVESDAQSEVAEFGMVLSQEEASAYRSMRTEIAASDAIKAVLAEFPGFAGSQVFYDGPLAFEGLTVFVSPESFEEARRVSADFETTGFNFNIEQVTSSWAELRSVSRVLQGVVPDGEESLGRYTEVDVEKIQEATKAVDVVSWGYSIRNNSLIAYVDKGSPIPNSLRIDGLPSIQFGHVELVDEISDPCVTLGCGPFRAGLQIWQYNGNTPITNGICTLGFAIKDGTDEDYSTAGHCTDGNTTRTRLSLQRESGTSNLPNFFSFGPRRPLAMSDSSNGYFVNSTMDTAELNIEDHLVTNRLYISGVNGRIVNGTLPYSSTSIDEPVCKSGRSTGYTCGPINAIGINTTSSQTGLTLTDQFRTSALAIPGDSGSPVFRQNFSRVAVGTVASASSTNSYFGHHTNLSDIDPGTSIYTSTDKRRDYVLALFTTALGRTPSSGSYQFYRSNTAQGMGNCSVTSARQTLYNFLLSDEFKAKYGLTSFMRSVRIEKAYWAALGRAPDAGGRASWESNFDANPTESGWASIVASFANSVEFTNRINTGAAAYDGDVC